MRRFLFTLLSVGVILVASSPARTASRSPLRSPCRLEGSIIGYYPAVVVSPCNSGVRSGGELHRRDQLRTSPTGQITFTTGHVLRCTLYNGTAVIYPKLYVVLRLKSGSIFCKQAGNMRRWKFRGPNVTVTIVQPSPTRSLAGRRGDADIVFGMVALNKQTTVKVDQGAVRASARGTTRLVQEGSQVTTRRGKKPGQVRTFTPTPPELQTLSSLEQDVTTTTPADLRDLFKAQQEPYGVLIAETTEVDAQVAQQLTGIKILRLSAQDFRADPYSAALRIARFRARIVVVAGSFATMSSVVDELDDPDYQRLTGKQLLVVFAPVGDQGVPSPKVTAVAVSNDRGAYVGFCPVTVTFTAELTSHGAGTIFYTWLRSDGAIGPIESVVASEGKAITATTTWQIGSPGFTYDGSQALKILGPRILVSDPSYFSLTCTSIG